MASSFSVRGPPSQPNTYPVRGCRSARLCRVGLIAMTDRIGLSVGAAQPDLDASSEYPDPANPSHGSGVIMMRD